MNAKTLLKGVDHHCESDINSLEIRDICLNSQEVREGCLFAAMKGGKCDGRKFALIAQQKGARRALMLPVSAPFHSSLLVGAAQELARELARVEVNAPAIEVIANVDVACHKTPEGIREILALQAARPVQWVKTIEKMRDEGVTHIVECGPGKVLSGMIRRIAPEVKTLNIFDVASLAAVKSELDAASGVS